MCRKKYSGYALLTLFVLTSNIIILPFTTKAQTTTTIYIDPEFTITEIDTTFPLNISVAEVTDLCSWQVYMYFNKQILEATGYAEGPFLKSHGTTLFDGSYDNNYNETHGELWMYCLRTWSGAGVTGSGTLATTTFKAKTGGTSPLTLTNTILGNSTAQRIPHTTNDGNVQVSGPDIAITNVTPCKTIVGQGYTMKINVTVENQGDTTTTWNVTTYANTTLIETKEITLPSGNSTTITFTWDTTGFAKGNYTISAYAEPIPGEIDIADNTFTDGVVKVAIVGDINGDGIVDMTDLGWIAYSYGATPSDPEWNPNADITEDDIIDMTDIGYAAMHYGETYP